MLIQPEEGGKDSYDRFRGRLMIPIRDPRGRVIGFGGRILGEGEPKYLNSPDTPLFDKGRTLYNLDRAGPASRTAKRLIVVEGYMDVIALDRAGIAEVVAPNGTAVTEGAARADVAARSLADPVLRRRQRRAERPRSAPRPAPCPCSRPDRTLRFVELPAGQDPDDVIRTGGREAFEALLAKPEPLDARLWRHELEAEPLTTPEAWAGLKQRLIDHAVSDRPRRPRAASTARTGSTASTSSAAPPRLRPRAFSRNAAAPSRTAASSRQRRPVGAKARAIASRRHRRPDGPRPDPRLRQFPRGASRPLRAARGASDRRSAAPRKCATSWSTRPSPARRLIGTSLATILGGDGATGAKGLTAPWAFPSPDATAIRTAPEAIWRQRSRSSPRRRKWNKALEHATERLKRDLTDEALEEQQRLIEAQQGLRQRLAQLAGTD